MTAPFPSSGFTQSDIGERNTGCTPFAFSKLSRTPKLLTLITAAATAGRIGASAPSYRRQKAASLSTDKDPPPPSSIKPPASVSSASSPEILVSKMLKKIGENFELNLIESEYEKEDTHFKIPQKLKEVF